MNKALQKIIIAQFRETIHNNEYWLLKSSILPPFGNSRHYNSYWMV
jgi:hypothetical protein